MPSVTTLTPADGAVNVQPDAPIVAFLEDGSGVDVSLVELTVNGVSCTVANGQLTYWNHRRIVGGSQVNNWTAVYFSAAVPWFTASSATVSVEVIYDGSTLTSATFTAAELELGFPTGQGQFQIWAQSPDWQQGTAQGWYYVVDPFASAAEQTWYYLVTPPPDGECNGYYYVGHYEAFEIPASLIAGAVTATEPPMTLTVQGVTGREGAASHLVQAWIHGDRSAALLPAVFTTTETPAAMVTAITTSLEGTSAQIVYTVNRGTVVEVRSITPATAAFLDSLGVSRE